MSNQPSPEIQKAADKLIGKIDQLHSAPHIAQKILSLTRDPDFSLDDVTKCLESDPAMSARILRVVNSSRYGLQHKVTSVKHAAAYIGLRSLRLITLTFGVVETLTRGISGNLYAEFWRRALSVATIASNASLFSAKENNAPMEDAYTGGLLADMGVLVFAQIHSEEYAKLYESVHHGPELLALEQETFGCDHASLGARLLEHWELPEALVHAVLHHHNDQDENSNPLEMSIVIGDLMAEALWNPTQKNISQVKSLLEEKFELDDHDFINFAMTCRDDIFESAELFEVELEGMIDTDLFIVETRALSGEETLAENPS